MNMQALLKQAQSMQKEITKAKEEIDKTSFTSENGAVKITMTGAKIVQKVEIDKDADLSKDDFEMLEDMILVAVNETIRKIDKVTEEKLGKYTNSMPGLF